LRNRSSCSAIQCRITSAQTGVPIFVMVADNRAGDRSVNTMVTSSGSPAVRVSNTDFRFCSRGELGRTFFSTGTGATHLPGSGVIGQLIEFDKPALRATSLGGLDRLTLDADLEHAGIPKEAIGGKLDLHAVRLAYIKLVIEAGATVKEAQTLARHATPQMTMGVYGRTREERLHQVVEHVAMVLQGETQSAHSVPSVQLAENTNAVNAGDQSVYGVVHPVEAAGIEPQDAAPSPHASSPHRHAQRRHFRALRPSRASHDPSPDAPAIHEQYTGVHDERAHSVHMDPDLAAVIAAWPTLAAPVRATILQLVATEEVAP
jgi:hypothetical protein